jgi:hypothetical protein
MSIHSHQVHCVHIHGWYTRNWCYRCRRHWAETCGVDGCSKYEQTATDDLVRAVVREMCDGDLASLPQVRRETTLQILLLCIRIDS